MSEETSSIKKRVSLHSVRVRTHFDLGDLGSYHWLPGQILQHHMVWCGRPVGRITLREKTKTISTTLYQTGKMSRRSYLQRSVPIIDAKLGFQDPKISRQRANLPTTIVEVSRLPPLSSCIQLQVRAKLQENTDNMTTEERDSFKAVASWEFYGIQRSVGMTFQGW